MKPLRYSPGLVCLFLTFFTHGQCPVTNFSIPASACLSQSVALTNLTTGGSSYYWDFCSDDLQAAPAVAPVTTSGSIAVPFGYKTVNDNGKWYGFIVSTGTNRLFRADFGTDPQNPDPVYTDLGNFGGLLTQPEDIDLLNVAGTWYAVVARNNFSGPLLLDFGANIENPAAVATELTDFGIGTKLRGISLAFDGTRILMAVSSSNANVTIVNFRNSFYNSIGAPDKITTTIAGSAAIIALDIYRTCTNWYLYATPYAGSGTVHRLKYGTDLFTAPVQTLTYPVPSVLNPWDIDVVAEGNKSYMIVSSESSPYSLIDLGNVQADDTPVAVATGNPSATVFSKMDAVPYQGTFLFHGIYYGSGLLQRITYSKTCGASIGYSEAATPPVISYSNSGSHKVLLRAAGGGTTSEITKTIAVSAQSAPSVDFTSANVCVNNSVFFTPVTGGGTITGYQWDFGDSHTSTASNPSNIYTTTGTYTASLQVTASNGCQNFTQKPVTIYNQPVSSFVLPAASPVCTNQNYVSVNTSTADAGSNPTWEWRVNTVLVSTAQDLNYAFPTAAAQTIQLTALIPGCSHASSQTIPAVLPGPLVDYTYLGNCQGAAVQFTNGTAGSGLSFAWDFDDGNTSTQVNPVNTYSLFGPFQVSLTATAPNGCQNSTIKTVNIYSQPQPDFSLDLPPFSCSGTPSQFNDATPNPTDSNVSGWNWTFGDGAGGTSLQRNPLYTYSLAGPYDVGLTVTTNFGCTGFVQKTITISPSPTAAFSHAAACVNQGTQFTDNSSGSIKSWFWQIGSSTYTFNNPVHVFSSQGNYTAQLTVTENNNCVASLTQPVSVPLNQFPDFSAQGVCATMAGTFQNTSAVTVDPFDSFTWNFGGLGTGSGSPVQFVFPATGSQSVTMDAHAQSGCVYSVTRIINVSVPPEAAFTATPGAGAVPLEVRFINTSVNATAYLWRFNDSAGTTSGEVSPSFTFTTLGDYVVDLEASNAAGCVDVFSKVISAVVPSMDAALTGLELIPSGSSGEWQVLFVVENKGNLPVTNPVVTLEMPQVSIRETLAVTVPSGESISQVLPFRIQLVGLDYVCLYVEAPSDINPYNDKQCVGLTDETVLLGPYPNPAEGELHVDWVASDSGEARVRILTSTGSSALDQTVEAAQPGLNQLRIDVSGLSAGVYVLVFEYPGISKAFRFVVP